MFQTSPSSSNQFNHQDSNDMQPIFHKNRNQDQFERSEKSHLVDSISSNHHTINQNILNGSSRTNQLNSQESFSPSSCISSKHMLKISSNDLYQSNSTNSFSKSDYNSDFYPKGSTKNASPNQPYFSPRIKSTKSSYSNELGSPLSSDFTPISPSSLSPQSIVSEQLIILININITTFMITLKQTA